MSAPPNSYSGTCRTCRLAAEAGPHTAAGHFADWEVHSRGIASKLLTQMGYAAGRGLGKQGRVMVVQGEHSVRPTASGCQVAGLRPMSVCFAAVDVG